MPVHWPCNATQWRKGSRSIDVASGVDVEYGFKPAVARRTVAVYDDSGPHGEFLVVTPWA